MAIYYDWDEPRIVERGAVTGVGDVATVLVTVAELAQYLGDVSATDFADELERCRDAALDHVERFAGISFRERVVTATVPEARASFPIRLPWGVPHGTPALTATLDGDAYTDFEIERAYDWVSFLTPEDGGELVLTYTVGVDPVPAVARQAVLRVAEGMWRAESEEGRRFVDADLRALLFSHMARDEWA